MTYKIKLQPGDYCRRDMGEDKYREVAQRFFDDGCPEFEHVGSYSAFFYFGWSPYVKDGFLHFDHGIDGGRELTYDEIMERSEEYKKLEQNYDAYKAAITNQEKEPMTDDIWKDAPEGATHYSKVMKDGFYKKNGDNWFYFNTNKNEWRLSHASDNFHDKLAARPTQDWQKNNELPIGLYELPPLGKYEITHNGHKGIWRGVEILKYEYDPSDHEYPRAAVKHLYGGDESFTAGCLYWVYGLNDDDFEFRPLKSDREKSIEEITDLLYKIAEKNINSEKAVAEQLYDSGLRFMTHIK